MQRLLEDSATRVTCPRCGYDLSDRSPVGAGSVGTAWDAACSECGLPHPAATRARHVRRWIAALGGIGGARLTHLVAMALATMMTLSNSGERIAGWTRVAATAATAMLLILLWRGDALGTTWPARVRMLLGLTIAASVLSAFVVAMNVTIAYGPMPPPLWWQTMLESTAGRLTVWFAPLVSQLLLALALLPLLAGLGRLPLRVATYAGVVLAGAMFVSAVAAPLMSLIERRWPSVVVEALQFVEASRSSLRMSLDAVAVIAVGLAVCYGPRRR
ncbi:MAG: hypothetical protein SGJ11_09995 [Phycisphaerae bacterium]|nr:hypothetical protein [Phycisphaerae bacterium]